MTAPGVRDDWGESLGQRAVNAVVPTKSMDLCIFILGP